MGLKSLLLSSDEHSRVLRRVLSDLEIDVEHCTAVDQAIRRITRQRFEAIIADGANVEDAGSVLRGAKAAPVNKRALTVIFVESPCRTQGRLRNGRPFCAPSTACGRARQSQLSRGSSHDEAGTAAAVAGSGTDSSRVFRMGLAPLQRRNPRPLRRRHGDPVCRTRPERELPPLFV